jgi:hypothetical protein
VTSYIIGCMSDGTEEHPQKSQRRWDPDHALAALAEQRTVMDVNVHDPMQIAEAVNAVFRENAQVAALSIVHSALHDPSPKVRLDAAKFVLEKATAGSAGDQDPLAKLIHDLYTHIDEEATPGGGHNAE